MFQAHSVWFCLSDHNCTSLVFFYLLSTYISIASSYNCLNYSSIIYLVHIGNDSDGIGSNSSSGTKKG